MPELTQHISQGVTLLGDERRPGGVTFAFTERTGGVSEGPFASLNLGDRVGDDPSSVAENRRRACAAIGAGQLASRLVCPQQVHGTDVVVIRDYSAEAVARAQEQALSGADAIVCTAPDVPSLICTADCVPVVLVAQGGYAVIHSGWRGTFDEISAKALDVLCSEASCAPSQVLAYIGPHIKAPDYEVSDELARSFSEKFGASVVAPARRLSLEGAIIATLEAHGVPAGSIISSDISTASEPSRLFSFRASGGACGRQGALALIAGGGGAHG